MTKKLPQGHSGSWFALWEEESIPCIHKHALTGNRYFDPGVNDHPAWPKFIAALQSGRKAIVTTSHPRGDDGIRRRDTYVSIWEIGDIEVADNAMSFDLIKLLHRFPRVRK